MTSVSTKKADKSSQPPPKPLDGVPKTYPHRRAAVSLNNTIQASGRFLLASEVPSSAHRKIYTDDETVIPYTDVQDYLSIPLGPTSDLYVKCNQIVRLYML